MKLKKIAKRLVKSSQDSTFTFTRSYLDSLSCTTTTQERLDKLLSILEAKYGLSCAMTQVDNDLLFLCAPYTPTSVVKNSLSTALGFLKELRKVGLPVSIFHIHEFHIEVSSILESLGYVVSVEDTRIIILDMKSVINIASYKKIGFYGIELYGIKSYKHTNEHREDCEDSDEDCEDSDDKPEVEKMDTFSIE